MSNKTKPVLVHRTITYIRASLVDEEVESLVAQLVNVGYKKIKVIVHDQVPGDGIKTSTEHSTTVIATLSANIDIGFLPPN